MQKADAIVVGGGPAGSTCAWKLREAGLDVLVLDRATFPRTKLCAGWVTPEALQDLELDLAEELAKGRHEVVLHELPDDHFNTYVERIQAMLTTGRPLRN